MAHDAEERQQYNGRAQQFEALHEGGRSALNRRLLDGSHEEQNGREYAYYEEDAKEYPPIQSEFRNDHRGPPHGKIRSRERGNGLDELSEGKCRRQIAATHHSRYQRVERCLHEGVADT